MYRNKTYQADYTENNNRIFLATLKSEDQDIVSINANNQDIARYADNQVVIKLNFGCVAIGTKVGDNALILQTDLEENESFASIQDVEVFSVEEGDTVFYNKEKRTSYLQFKSNGDVILHGDKFELTNETNGVLNQTKIALQTQYDINTISIANWTSQYTINDLIINNATGLTPFLSTLLSQNAIIQANITTLTTKNSELLAKINILSNLIATT